MGKADIPNDAGDFMPFHAVSYALSYNLSCEPEPGVPTPQMQDLRTLTTAAPEYQNGYSIAYDVNDNGQVVGTANALVNSEWVFQPFIYDNTNGMQALARDPVHTDISDEWYAVTLTNAGAIGGHVRTAPNQSIPYYWPGRFAQPVPLLMPSGFPYGELYGSNAAGQMVGMMWSSDGATEHAFMYDTVNGVQDLNDLIDPTCQCTMAFARDINDDGRIVGYGDSNGSGDMRGFVLDPPGN